MTNKEMLELAFKYKIIGTNPDSIYSHSEELSNYNPYTFGRYIDVQYRSIQIVAKSDFKSWNFYRRGEVLGVALTVEQQNKMLDQYPGAVKEEIIDDVSYNLAVAKQRTEMTEIEDLFVAGLFYLTNTIGNPRAHKAYSLAYERGHANGFEEVACEYENLVDLIN